MLRFLDALASETHVVIVFKGELNGFVDGEMARFRLVLFLERGPATRRPAMQAERAAIRTFMSARLRAEVPFALGQRPVRHSRGEIFEATPSTIEQERRPRQRDEIRR